MGFKRSIKLSLAAAAALSAAACDDLSRVADGMSRSVLDNIEAMVTASRPVQMANEAPAARAMNVERTEYSPIPPLLFAPGELIMKPVQNVSTASFSVADEVQIAETLTDIADRAIAQTGIEATPTRIDETSGQVVITLDAALQAAADDAAAGGTGVRPMAFTGIAGPDGADGAVITAQTVRMATERGNGCQNVSAKEMNENLGLATECAAAKLKASGKFEYVELNYIMRPEMELNPIGAAVTLPNDPLFSLQWGFRDQGTKAGQLPGGASFQSFWSRSRVTGRRNVVVAIVDTGIDKTHPDIANNPNVVEGFDMVSDIEAANDGDGRDADAQDAGDRCDVNDPSQSDSFHGTHVAGTIGAVVTGNKEGVAGGAWNVTIVPVRAVGRCGGKLTDIADGIRWAAGVGQAQDSRTGAWVRNKNPAKIINVSLGFFAKCPSSLQAAIDDARSAGAIIVAAAGNARANTANYSPSSCRGVVVVAAGDTRGYLTPYSNWGSQVSIMAPGGDMKRDDDKDNRPDGILSTKRSKQCKDPITQQPLPNCFYAYEMGTSMAAPHAAAALALLKSQFPEKTNEELVSMLVKQARTPRTQIACSGACDVYPGSTPISGQSNVCFRPCGSGLLNLSLVGTR